MVQRLGISMLAGKTIASVARDEAGGFNLKDAAGAILAWSVELCDANGNELIDDLPADDNDWEGAEEGELPAD